MESRLNIGNAGLDENSVVREIERKQAKQSIMLFWICLICLLTGIAGTVILWHKVNNQNLEGIEPVQVRVVDVIKKNIRINGNNNIRYEVTVEYKGQEYKLQNGGYSPWIYTGHKGTAYLYQEQIYASEGSVANGTGVGKLYYVFVFTTLGFLFITAGAGSKASRRRKRLLEKD